MVFGVWWWRSLAFVSTDDARVKANIVTISAEIAGRITTLAKDEGDTVVPGEVLAQLDRTEVMIQIRRTRAEVDGARGRMLQTQRQVELLREQERGQTTQAKAALRGHQHNLEDARVHAKQAKKDWQRNKTLHDKKLISEQYLAHAETERRQAEARLAALKEKIKEAEAALELVRIAGKEVAVKEADLLARQAEVREINAKLADLTDRRGRMSIRSPVQGTIVKKNAHRGEFVEPGKPIFMVVDTTRFWVEANVEETQIRFVKPGNKAIVRVDSYPGQEFIGRVTEIGGATVSEFSLFSPQKLTGVFIKSTQRLPVKIALENTNGLLKVGMQAVVAIQKDGR